MNSLGFKKSLLLIVTSLLIIALLISGLFSYQILKQNAVDSLIERVQTSIQYEAGDIDAYIRKNADPAKAMSTLYEKYDYQTSHEKYAELTAVLGGVTKVTIGFDDGSSYVSRPSNSTFPGGIGIKSKYDPRTRSWYQSGKATPGLGLSDIFFTKQDEPMFGATHPIKDGIVLADIRLGQLQGIVEGIQLLEGNVGIILDKNGLILASTAEYAEVKGNISDIAEFQDFASEVMNSERTLHEVNINGSDVLVFSQRVDLLGDVSMYLIMALDSKIAFAPINKQMKNMITTLVTILVIFSVIIILCLNYLYKPVLELRDVVKNLSSGECDLTQRLRVKSDDDLGQIAGSVNTFIENLQGNMVSVRSLTSSLSSGVQSLEQQLQTSTSILSEHVNQTNSVATSMQELNASAEQVATSATEAAEFVAGANRKGESSRESIEGAQSSILGLVSDIDAATSNVETMNQETKDINSVLSVIGSIAEQTNLLALNAAIEAARAGEQGRGFAVVADEVRALAARTQESTGEIESSLSKLQSGAESAVLAIQKTKETSENTATDVHRISDTMEDLVQQVNEVDGISSGIAQAADEQNSVIHGITESVSNIHTMVEELTRTGQSISEETVSISDVNRELMQIVSRFKLG